MACCLYLSLSSHQKQLNLIRREWIKQAAKMNLTHAWVNSHEDSILLHQTTLHWICPSETLFVLIWMMEDLAMIASFYYSLCTPVGSWYSHWYVGSRSTTFKHYNYDEYKNTIIAMKRVLIPSIAKSLLNGRLLTC